MSSRTPIRDPNVSSLKKKKVYEKDNFYGKHLDTGSKPGMTSFFRFSYVIDRVYRNQIIILCEEFL